MAILSTTEKKLVSMASEWLRDLKSDLGRSGCNDFWIPNTPENVQLLRAMEDWNDTDEEDRTIVKPDDKDIYVPDFFIVGYIAHYLGEMVKTSSNASVPGTTSVLDAEEGEG